MVVRNKKGTVGWTAQKLAALLIVLVVVLVGIALIVYSTQRSTDVAQGFFDTILGALA